MRYWCRVEVYGFHELAVEAEDFDGAYKAAEEAVERMRISKCRDVGACTMEAHEAPQCRVCGCTDDDCSGCVERTGQQCCWVEEDLCSACAPSGARA